jgi:nitrite reductase (NADH) small subunit
MTKHEIGTVDDFPEQQGTKVTIDGIEIAVFNIDGELYGINDMCPHKNLPLHPAGRGRIVSEPDGECPPTCADGQTIGSINADARTVNCPWHGLEVSLESGTNRITEQAVATYDIEVDGETVYAVL